MYQLVNLTSIPRRCEITLGKLQLAEGYTLSLQLFCKFEIIPKLKVYLKNYVCSSPLLLLLFIYFTFGDRERMQAGKRGREKERENPKQTPCSE